MSTKFINLDELVSEKISIRFKGVDHELKTVTVEDFIVNIKEIQEIGTAPGMEREIELTMNLLCRAFPTMTRDLFVSMTMDQMQKLTELAHNNNGQTASNADADAAAAQNPPKAAQ